MGQTENNEKLALQAFAALLLMAVSGFFGYRFGHSYQSRKEWADRSPSSECLKDSRGFGAYASINQDFRDPDGPNSEYLGVLKKNHLEEKDHKLSLFFPPSDIGRGLTQVTTLFESGNAGNSVESRILFDGIKQIESQPWEALSSIKGALKRMGPELASERVFLLDLGNRLDVDPNEKMSFLLEELSRPPLEGESKVTQLTNSLSLAYLMQMGADPGTVETALRQVLSNATAPYSLKSLLIGIYEAKYPDQGKRLRDEQGI